MNFLKDKIQKIYFFYTIQCKTIKKKKLETKAFIFQLINKNQIYIH